MRVPVRRRAPLVALFAGTLLLAAPGAVRAADPPRPADTALGKVPADAEFFRSFLRMGETVEAIGRTRAWKQLWTDPTVQEAWKQAKEKFNAGEGEWAPLKKFLDDPANKDLPGLVADVFSNEIFVYTGDGTGDMIALMQETIGGARYGPALAKALGNDMGDAAEARARIILRSLAEKPERIRIPQIVIGFKVSDPAKVAAQLKRLDPLLADALKDTPLKGRSKRQKVGDDEFLVLTLDGSLVPWDEVKLDKYEEKPGEFAPLIKHLKGMKLTLSLGVRQGYLLFAIGSSPEQIAKFGGAGPKLADRPELKPLAKATKPLTAVGYTSARLRQAVATTPEDVLGFNDLAKAGLEKAELPDALRKKIEKDVDSLLQSIAKGIKKPGASVAFSVRTARGWETFDYDYTPRGPGEPEPKPLTLLNHLGAEPVLAAMWRSGTTVEDYRAFVKWVVLFADDAEQAIVAKSPDAADMVKKFNAEIVPVLKELSDVTEKLWIPSLDGQQGFVVDAKWASRRWHESMPPADRELPLPELGIVVGVSDPAKLTQALEGYRTTLNKLIAKVRELDPTGSIPPVEIPKPKVETNGDKTFAFYPVPAEWGIDKQFQPTGGMTKTVAALALSRGHVDRLLTPLALGTDLAPFADLKRPLESAFYFHWARVVEAAGPWVGYAMSQIQVPGDRQQAEKVAAKVMAVLKMFRAYGSVTYREGGATVTHSEAVFADIEP
jgi:hypothetical protein